MSALICCFELNWSVRGRWRLSLARLIFVSFCLVNVYRTLRLFVALLLPCLWYEPVYHLHVVCVLKHYLYSWYGKSLFNRRGYIFENCNIGEVLYSRAFFLHKDGLIYLRVCVLYMLVVGGGGLLWTKEKWVWEVIIESLVSKLCQHWSRTASGAMMNNGYLYFVSEYHVTVVWQELPTLGPVQVNVHKS